VSGSTFRIRNQFDSTAKIIEISRFYFGSFEYSARACVDVTPDFEFQRKPGWWPSFPVLIQSNGLPWEIGNAYLLKLVETKQPWDMETVKSRATYLLAYLRFLEDTGTDFMHFPFRKSERVTYVFKDTLQTFISQGLNPLYASNIINTVVDFYRTIATDEMIGENAFENLPFKDVHRFVKFFDEKGFGRFKNVTTSDIAIRHSKPHKRLDRIDDGGQLRPLTIDEQKKILSGFKKELCPYNLELMMRIALSTGARMQTVCTIRVCHIKEAYKKLIEENVSSIEIQAGNGAKNEGHLINTKRGKLHRLLFPKKLIEDLYVYLTSEYHQSRMEKSYYGKKDINYIFLTETSSPYYISKQEIIDRQDDQSHYSVNSKDFVQNKGDTVRMNLKKCREKLKLIHPELEYFKFHDLRATFGMNLVRKLTKKGYKSARILSEVQSRMGHSSIATTQAYLDFDQIIERYEQVAVEFEEELLGGYESVGRKT
jgi:integrase